MKNLSAMRWLLLSFVMALPLSALATAPTPIALSNVTSIRVVSKQCGGSVAKSWHIEEAKQVAALLSEFESVRRQPHGIHAAKIGCSTRVSFYRGENSLTTIDVLPCQAFEKAPVSGKRYFTYKHGANHLPQLSALAGVRVTGRTCQ